MTLTWFGTVATCDNCFLSFLHWQNLIGLGTASGGDPVILGQWHINRSPWSHLRELCCFGMNVFKSSWVAFFFLLGTWFKDWSKNSHLMALYDHEDENRSPKLVEQKDKRSLWQTGVQSPQIYFTIPASKLPHSGGRVSLWLSRWSLDFWYSGTWAILTERPDQEQGETLSKERNFWKGSRYSVNV